MCVGLLCIHSGIQNFHTLTAWLSTDKGYIEPPLGRFNHEGVQISEAPSAYKGYARNFMHQMGHCLLSGVFSDHHGKLTTGTINGLCVYIILVSCHFCKYIS